MSTIATAHLRRRDRQHSAAETSVRLPFHKPFMSGNELVYVTEAVNSGDLRSDGRFTAACSALLKTRLSGPKVLMVPSGTAALELAAMLCDLQPGDEVIVPSFTFASTANAILRAGGKPVFAEIRPDTLNLDERRISERITAKTRAIFAVHYGGVSCEMDSLLQIAREHNLQVVEDAAHALGSSYKGAACGGLGHLGAFSFHSTKDLSCGEGGALSVNQRSLNLQAEILREKGTDRVRFVRGEIDKYDWLETGSSFLPSELTSAYLLAQLESLDRIRSARRLRYARYRTFLQELEAQECFRLPSVPAECETNGHMFYILANSAAERMELLQHLRRDGVQAATHFVPLHCSPKGLDLGYREGDFPLTEDLSGRLLRLPLYPDLTEDEQALVAKSLKTFFDARKRRQFTTSCDDEAVPSRNPDPVVIIGAGPAGLTAAYELGQHGTTCTVLEQDACVGGLSRTVDYKGYGFDIGGHRFFTKVKLVDQMWRTVLGEDFLRRPRLSRIYYQSTFFQYPVEPMNALRGLGLWETFLCGLSYLGARLRGPGAEKNLEDWLVPRFGRRLYRTFFKTYTEKVWGVPCREISADWAAQRIRGLSVMSVLKNCLLGASKDGPKTLIQEFDYPRKGPGMMWTRTRDCVVKQGSRVLTGMGVEKICWEPGRVTSVVAGGRRFEAENFVSSMPIRDLIGRLDPAPPEWVQNAAEALHYRDFLTVALIVKGTNLFPDNWIYVHDPDVAVGRIQNYNNWSPELVPDASTTCLGLEYFCFEGDHLWDSSDEELLERAKREMGKLGLADPAQVVDGKVVRAPKAYPVYDDKYQDALKEIRRFLQEIPNLQLIGRNGMHRYNNQDHSMLTGMLAARNILGQGHFDLWQVNADTDYHEDGFRLSEEEIRQMNATQPLTPAFIRN